MQRLLLAALPPLMLLLLTSSLAPTNARLLDNFLPLPQQLFEMGVQEIDDALSDLKDWFSRQRLIVKLKDEFRDGDVSVNSGARLLRGVEGVTVQYEGPRTGLDVLKLEDGLDVMKAFFDLRSMDIFDIVELDFQQYLADDGEAPVQPQGGSNPAMAAWQEINRQFEILKSQLDPGALSVDGAMGNVSAVTPTDPEWDRQWNMRSIGTDHAWSLIQDQPLPGGRRDSPDDRLERLPTGGQDDSEIVIAVLDTGVDYNHPDLRDRMWVNLAEKNGLPGVDDDGNGCIDDIHGCNVAGQLSGDYDVMDTVGHGTHCAGIAAASHNNSVGVAGVAPNVRIMAVKIFDDSGASYDSDAIKGIEYAIRMGAHISSNSWSTRGDHRLGAAALQRAVRASYEAGQVFVAAAGNSGRNTDPINTREYPAGLNDANIISVLATDQRHELAKFGDGSSNYGAGTVDIGAPGWQIYSTLPGGQHGYKSGTSMAVPHVAGAAALVYDQLLAGGNFTGAAPQDRALLVKAVLLYSSIDTAALQKGCVTEGRLNAYGAVIAAREGMTGNFSRLLFPEVDSTVDILSIWANYKWIIIAVCASVALLCLICALIACCACRGSSSSHKYRY
mmetsp:Transcript_27111/g.68135  ORF Transcript_27111/g.68135 Transcript_27111/m.68135 type:complete len:614 (+) Transcript_27111:129-1970(+)|eukprot:jgi/Tetstr1/443225/TSEL_031263.t1